MRSAFLVGEEGGESEIEEGDAEIDAAAAATTGMAVESGEPGALAGGTGCDFVVQVGSILVHDEGPSGGLDGPTHTTWIWKKKRWRRRGTMIW